MKWSCHKEDKYCMIPLVWGTLSGQKQRDKKYKGGCQGLAGKREAELLFDGHRSSVLQDGEFWRGMVEMIAQQYVYT